MTWYAQLRGDLDHLATEDRDRLEAAVRDLLAGVTGQLVPAGHQGVAATFQGSTGGPIDLTATAAPDAPPPPPPADVETALESPPAAEVASTPEEASEAPTIG